MERRQLEQQAHLDSGTAPGLVQVIEQAALATEAEGWHDVAGLLRGWAERLETHSMYGQPLRSELWIG